MGAFGRLLEARFGGTIHDVKTWNKPIKAKENEKLYHTCDLCGYDVEKCTYSTFHKKYACDDCIQEWYKNKHK